MRTALIALTVTLLATSAVGQTAAWTSDELLLAAGAKPLDAVGEDVIRFRGHPSFSGTAAVIEVRAPVGPWAGGVVTIIAYPVNDEVPRILSVTEFEISRGNYRALATLVDAGLADQAAWTPRHCGPNCTEVAVLCIDGPGHRVERRVNGRTVELEDWGPGGEANAKVARRLIALLPAPIAGAVPAASCFS